VHYAELDKQNGNISAEGLEDVLEAYNGGEADFHQIVADMANIPRSQAKTINLGLFYGMGKNKLQAELGLDKTDADELFGQYHSKVPFVKQLMYSVMDRAQDAGRIRTLLGRRCRFNLWEPNEFGINKALPYEEALREYASIRRAFTYKALNKLIQGSAADMTKKAMVELHKEGIVPHIQVHDELDISVDNNSDKIKKIMEKAVELKVPNKVDYEFGPNWGTIK
jgi:DNA polymerase I-like protein with 3'-5' exonuclease and polymerase domains